MKSRNDRVLYSGMSTAITRVEERRAERSREKESVRRVLEPSAELFTQIIQKERDLIPVKVMESITASMPDESSKSLIMAYKLYDTYLANLNMQIQNTMRIKESSNE